MWNSRESKSWTNDSVDSQGSPQGQSVVLVILPKKSRCIYKQGGIWDTPNLSHIGQWILITIMQYPKAYNCLHLYILHVFDIIYRIWKFKMYHTLYYIFNYVAIYLDLPSKINKLKLRHFFSLHNDVLKSCKTTWAVMSGTVKI